MLQATARLLKARHERTRNRTRERALLHMEQLLEALAAHAPAAGPEPGTTALQPQQGAVAGMECARSRGGAQAGMHLPYAYSCRFPLRVHLRKELAEHYMSMGFVGEWRTRELRHTYSEHARHTRPYEHVLALTHAHTHIRAHVLKLSVATRCVRQSG